MLTQPGDAGGDVGLNPLGRRLCDVVHVRESVLALVDAGRAPEVVEGGRGDPAFGEAQGQILVEAVEAADVREHDHACGGPFILGQRGERGEAVAVCSLEDEVLM